jgi:GST-like protein
MIDLYFWPTPNGRKLSIALEEFGLEYRIFPIHIGKGEQFTPEFLAISPNNRIPAIVDHAPVDGGPPLAVFESGAILLYLADKTGTFMPTGLRARTEAMEWLMWQMANVGPMMGQANHFALYAKEKLPYAIDRYVNETKRLFKVLNTRLAERDFMVGEYSIVDMATFPWIKSAREQHVKDMTEYPHVVRWLDAILARPAVVRGYAVTVPPAPPQGTP